MGVDPGPRTGRPMWGRGDRNTAETSRPKRPGRGLQTAATASTSVHHRGRRRPEIHRTAGRSHRPAGPLRPGTGQHKATRRPRSPGFHPVLQALSPSTPNLPLVYYVFVLTERELAGNVMLISGVQCKDSIFTHIAKERGACLHDQSEQRCLGGID